MNKRMIRLTESDLHSLILKSVTKILKETSKDNPLTLVNTHLDDIIETFGQEMYDSIDQYGDYEMQNYYELSEEIILYCDIQCHDSNVKVINIFLNDGYHEYTPKDMPELENICMQIQGGLQDYADMWLENYKTGQEEKDTENDLMSWGRI